MINIKFIKLYAKNKHRKPETEYGASKSQVGVGSDALCLFEAGWGLGFPKSLWNPKLLHYL